MLFNSILRFITVVICVALLTCCAKQDPLRLFPLNHYDQTISHWIPPGAADYDRPLISAALQQQHYRKFLEHSYGSLSPWDAVYVKKVLLQVPPDDIKTIQKSVLIHFSNKNKSPHRIGYSENFRPYTEQWLKDLADNMNLVQFEREQYQDANRAITIDNLAARFLPTADPHYYNHELAGQGYPFDNLQMSSIWAGTAVYILGTTQDHAWSLVLTGGDYLAWVKSNGLARTSAAFIKTWREAADKQLAAITQTKTSIIASKNKFLFSAYIGSVFPVQQHAAVMQLLIPIADTTGQASVNYVTVPAHQIALMPWPATRHHFAMLMDSLIGRPYGWGNMYFYNDCSSELKSLFTPFGIWLPRYSADQVHVGKFVDLSVVPAPQRLVYLSQHGHPFVTIVYIGGHIVLYIGNYQDPNNQRWMAMTYQDIWGLWPRSAHGRSRSVVGKSVFLPMLLQYAEDKSLVSLADRKYFQVAFLDNI